MVTRCMDGCLYGPDSAIRMILKCLRAEFKHNHSGFLVLLHGRRKDRTSWSTCSFVFLIFSPHLSYEYHYCRLSKGANGSFFTFQHCMSWLESRLWSCDCNRNCFSIAKQHVFFFCSFHKSILELSSAFLQAVAVFWMTCKCHAFIFCLVRLSL